MGSGCSFSPKATGDYWHPGRVPRNYTGVWRTYFGKKKTSSVASERHYVNGRLHGAVTFWRASGPLSLVSDREPDRVQVIDDGPARRVKVKEMSYKNGRPHGKEIEWYNDGRKWTEVNWVNGRKRGREVCWGWHDDEELILADGIWKNGKPWQGVLEDRYGNRHLYKDGREIKAASDDALVWLVWRARTVPSLADRPDPEEVDKWVSTRAFLLLNTINEKGRTRLERTAIEPDIELNDRIPDLSMAKYVALWEWSRDVGRQRVVGLVWKDGERYREWFFGIVRGSANFLSRDPGIFPDG